jgi:A/G-specific adenine glycosylase
MKPAEMSTLLLEWYDQHRRVLPWRGLPGEAVDPYRVWLSEIMLQQTTVATVRNRFETFVDRWPSVHDLATATLDDVLTEWAGLGYYARARNLHKCAVQVSSELEGKFPDDQDALKKLPGIGDYTSAAIAAIAFDQPATVVDGNVERVITRLHRIQAPLPSSKKAIKKFASARTPAARSGDYAQALMDLGATVCTPRNPTCGMCPWADACDANKAGDQALYPVKAPRKKRPTRRASIYWIERQASDGPEVWMRRRPEKGLLGGMMEFPSTEWAEPQRQLVSQGGQGWDKLDGQVIHVFTHFRLELAVFRRADGKTADLAGQWVPVHQLGKIALPTLMKKVSDLVLRGKETR